MRKYVQFITKNRPFLAVFLVATIILSIVGVFKIQLGNSFDVFTPNQSIYQDRLNEMAEDFPASDQLLVLIEANEPEMTEATYTKIVRFNQQLKDNLGDIRLNGMVKETDPTLIGPDTLIQAKQSSELLGEMAPITYRDGKTFYTITMFSDRALNTDDIHLIETTLEDLKLDYAISGDSYVQLKIFDYIFYILTRVPPLAMIVLFLVFYSKLRTIRGTILSVLPAGLGSLWTMGLIGYLGQEVSIITVLAPIFTLVIGSADGLHFITHIQEEQLEGKPTEEVLTHTLQMVGVPMITTTITSMVGFLALIVMDTRAIISLAVFASVGIFLAGIATWYVLPLILSTGIQLGYKVPKNVDKDLGLRRFWGKPIWLIIAFVFFIFGSGGQLIQQEFNMLSIYRPFTDVYKYVETISDINGGALPVFIYGDLPKGDPSSMIKEVLSYENDLRGLEEVGKVVSAVDFMDKLGGNPALMGQNSAMLGEFVNIGTQKLRLMVFPIDHNNATLKAISDFVDEKSVQYEAYNFKPTGVGFMMMELNEGMIFNQVSSSVLAVLLVFALLWITLRHLRAALISIVPIVLTLLMLFGVMGLTNISLNLITCTIFSITIGVGIDYAIHFTSIWRTKVKEGLSSSDSAIEAYRYTSRPIIANAFGLSLGFTALMLSPLQIHVTVSILMWIAMMSSVVFSLIILPTLLSRVKS